MEIYNTSKKKCSLELNSDSVKLPALLDITKDEVVGIVTSSRYRGPPKKFEPEDFRSKILSRSKRSKSKLDKSNKDKVSKDLSKIISDIRNNKAKYKNNFWIQRGAWLKKLKKLREDKDYKKLQENIICTFNSMNITYANKESVSLNEKLYLHKILEERHRIFNDDPLITNKWISDRVDQYKKSTMPFGTSELTDKEKRDLEMKYPESKFKNIIFDIINAEDKKKLYVYMLSLKERLVTTKNIDDLIDDFKSDEKIDESDPNFFNELKIYVNQLLTTTSDNFYIEDPDEAIKEIEDLVSKVDNLKIEDENISRALVVRGDSLPKDESTRSRSPRSASGIKRMLRHTRKMFKFKPNKLFTFKKANKKTNRISNLNASSQSQKKKYYKKKSTSAKIKKNK